MRIICMTVCAGVLLGYGFGVREWDIQYFPIDEDHPSYATDTYSFSKTVVEEIGKILVVYYFVFRHPVFDEPIDGIVYAVTAALGIAITTQPPQIVTDRPIVWWSGADAER